MQTTTANRTIEAVLSEHLGQPIGILCARYWYRGILSEIGDRWVRLTNAYCVEQTGVFTATKATIEEPFPSDVLLKLDFVEIIAQPAWIFEGVNNPPTKRAQKEKK